MATVVRENIGLLNDKLLIKLGKEDYLPSFEKSVKEYSKKANVPGFRKGMVPAGMIRKMYGPSLFTDEILRSVEKELFVYLDKERPDIFARPLPLTESMPGFDMNNPADYEFGFEIGLKPEFSLPDLAKGKFTLNDVEITDAMLEDEINRLRIKGGKMVDKELVDHEENVLNILLTEVAKDGQAVNDGISKENSVLVKYLSAPIQKEVMGKKAGDKINFQLKKAFEGDKLEMMLQDLGFEKHDKEAAEKYFNLEMVKIGNVEKREMDETFFNELFPGRELKTEADFKEALRSEISKYWEGQSKNQLHDQIYHFLLDETKMNFPETFLKRWLQEGTEQQKTPQQAEEEFPTFSNQLKWTLISDKLMKDNNIEVQEPELRAHMKNEVMGYFGQLSENGAMEWLDSYVERMMKDEKQVDSTYRRLITEKMFKWAEDQVKPKQKKVTPDELNAMQHHHH
jgi:trigger factor